MGGLVGRGGRKTKRLIKGALQSVGPSPELLLDLAQLRNQVQANTNQLELLARQVGAILEEMESFRMARGDFSPGHMPLADLSGFVVGLGERVHMHEQDLKEINRKIERFGGSVLDEMALDRRLRKIEDSLSASSDVSTTAE